MNTDTEFVEAIALRGRDLDGSDFVAITDDERDRLVALAQCGLRLAKDVSDGMDCLPSCNADAHDEICPFAHSEVAWRTLRQQLADAKARLIWWHDRWTSEQARVQKLEANATEIEGALEVWATTPCGCALPKDGTHASLAELSRCLLDAAAARVRALEEALEDVRQRGRLADHSHWDAQGNTGRTCPVCMQQAIVQERVRAALARRTP